ncbi:hypothetical protein [Kutzneria sp. CA-103260]|uniref:hypothetical protein n=1 Tax=Kutzneria sp. CA-103260 TaxID=2802641 RepID=UPI001BAACC9F|nr:hypothetical protein [Kutzneria sp. CA-103260]
MSKSDDPERLLAEALRAQAVSTPVTMPPLPAVLTKAAEQAPDQPEATAEDEPAAPDEAAEAESVTDQADAEADQAEPAVDAEKTADPKPAGPEAEAKPEAEPAASPQPPTPPQRSGDSPFTEEMVLRELSSGQITGEVATLRINNAQQHYETERFSPLENLYGSAGGPGFGLISGSEVGSTVGPPVGEFDHLLMEPPTSPVTPDAVATNAVPTTKMRAERGQVPGWLILLFALVLGLAGGAVAGLLSML